MNSVSFVTAIFATIVQQLGPEVVAMLISVLDGNGAAVTDEIHQIAISILADLQKTVTTDVLRAQLIAMEQGVDAIVNVAEEAKLASEGQK